LVLQTEFPFELPKGLVDDSGGLHREGTMRLATAMDEILPLRDPRVRANEAYLVVLLLARVITRLGGLTAITPEVIENLYAADLAYLQDLYRRINDVELPRLNVRCPNCDHAFEVEVPLLGES
jgi:hypothetical protein